MADFTVIGGIRGGFVRNRVVLAWYGGYPARRGWGTAFGRGVDAVMARVGGVYHFDTVLARGGSSVWEFLSRLHGITFPGGYWRIGGVGMLPELYGVVR